MIDAGQFRNLVVRPVLEELDPVIPYSLAAENLLVGTAAHESRLTYLHQIKGPALGIYQIEPRTHRDLWDNYIAYRLDLAGIIRGLAGQHSFTEAPERELVWNLAYSTAMARVYYRRIPAPLPDADDLWALGSYWKTYYNTALGKGTVEQWVMHYPRDDA